MSMAQTQQDVLQQLENALEANHIPDEEKRRASQLLLRLRSPVQVTLIGNQEAGKSRLINMLIGESAFCEAADIPLLEITFGPKTKTIFLQTDGEEKAREGLHLNFPAPTGTAIVRVEMPLPILNRLSLTELTLSGALEEQQAIADWALSRADVVLWCSQTFDESEQLLWASASEALKDHSFLVLSKADQLQMQGALNDRIDQLAEIVADEFYRMYPVATIQAISSLNEDGSRDEGAWTSSGGRALTDAVLQLVDTGRQADADNALVFLNRYAPALAHPDFGTPVPKKEPVSRPDDRQVSNVVQTGSGKVLAQALDFLQERADLMLDVVSDNRPGKQSIILDHCLETADKLSEIMMEVDQVDPPLSVIQEDIMECSDMMVLFHLEKTESAAADAVTLLLQLKKEMSVAAAG